MSGLIFDELTSSSTTAKYAIGQSRQVSGKSYLYVQAAADTTVANGTVLYGTFANGDIVTSDISDTGINMVRGVGVGVIAAESYGWIQTWGAHTAVLTTYDNVGCTAASNTRLIGSPTTDGNAVCITATNASIVMATSTSLPAIIGTVTVAKTSYTNTSVAAFIQISK